MTTDDRGIAAAGEEGLEALFAAARADAARPAGAALVGRVEADALRHLPRPRRARVARGAWLDLVRGLGGWPAMGGLATAAAAGFWLGYAPPAGLDRLLPGAGEGSEFLPADYAGLVETWGAVE